MKNRRTFERLPSGEIGFVTVGTDRAACELVNASAGGVCFLTSMPCQIGQLAELELEGVPPQKLEIIRVTDGLVAARFVEHPNYFFR